jgi:intracellular septation protein
MSEAAPDKRKLGSGLKFLLEMGPLVLFFVVYNRADIFVATAVLVAAVLAALAATYVLTRHIPMMPLVTAALVTVFGALTWFLHDATFIKMKATIVYALFGAALIGGLLFGKALLPYAFDSMISLDEAGWRKLTLRWGVFFFALAALNEVVWRTQTEDFWVKFKVFGFVPLTLVFALAQTPLILRHELKGAKAEKAPEHL